MEGKVIDNLEDVQYFLARIEEFEKTYRMESWQFLFLYENSRDKLSGYSGRSAVDYSEWAFLWENFHSHMNQSPPWVVNDTDQQKPEHRSGFCFSGGKRDQLGATLFRSCRESSFGQEQPECRGRY